MKKLILLVVAMTIIAMSGVAIATDTALVQVSATVTGTCKFNSGGTVTFALDPATGGNVAGTVVQPVFWCVKGSSYSITDDDGLHKSGTTHQVKHATLADTIPYSFTYTAAGSGQGKTSPITLNIASQIVEADYVTASAGSYADTVTLTINP